ncbi:unnamed protein product [Anisakis simplex]|uniref:Uncharacterized protein n=1 Tax=Anisakis simplex TaxID=6269 RepID=A0A3P6Q2L3_ANISI|nr:unnamed protein product [Anisakis simplex]
MFSYIFSPTIIHHFYGYDQVSNREAPFLYPDFAGGLAISSALFQQLHRTSSNHQRATDFSIDPKHEFARMVFETADGITLTDTHRFCLLHNEANDCITRYIEPTYEYFA